MGQFKLSFSTYGDRSILVEWPKEITKTILHDRLCFENKIRKKHIKQIVDIISSYSSLLIIYKFSINNFYRVKKELLRLYNEKTKDENQLNYKWTIPVCYDDEFGIDLVAFCHKKNISAKAVIDMHTNPLYTVYFIGFLPGFLYLGGLDERLHLTRKPSPSLNIKKGSVALGGSQTGIYSANSPGGWHVIGSSPINWFDVTNERPCFALAGDQIQFKSIDRSTYDEIFKEVSLNQYQLEREVIND